MDEAELESKVIEAASKNLDWVPQSVERLHSVESEVFELRSEGRRAIFKARDWEGGIALETWAYEAARSLGVKTAEVLASDLSRSVYPLPFYIQQYIGGTCLQELGSSEELSSVHRAAGEELHKLHELELPGWGWIERDRLIENSEVRGIHADWISELRAHLGWAGPYIQEHKLLPTTTTTRVEKHLKTLAPTAPPERGVLLHGDLSPWHFLVDPKTLFITGMIDFGDASVGDPLWDIACYSELSIDFRDWLLQGYGLQPSEEQLALLHFYRLIRSLAVLRWNHEHGFNIEEVIEIIDEELSRLPNG